jgi:hypothetical protein
MSAKTGWPISLLSEADVLRNHGDPDRIISALHLNAREVMFCTESYHR